MSKPIKAANHAPMGQRIKIIHAKQILHEKSIQRHRNRLGNRSSFGSFLVWITDRLAR